MALVFLDLDGTLIDDGKPASMVKEAIIALKENGHIPIIATGRIPYLLEGVKNELGIDSYIAANGSYIYHMGKVIYEKYIPKEVVKRFVDAIDELHSDMAMEGVNDYVAYRKETDLVHLFSDTFSVKYPEVDRNFYLNNEILAFMIFEDETALRLRSQFPELLFNKTNQFGYDVNIKGDLKADGVRVMLQYLNYTKDDVYAIGDGYNDISMFQAVQVGIAMGNSNQAVKNAATYVTTSVTENGVYNALKKYKLI
ncbi:MAG: Cof-type HAD-IIB family hydrolase [Firmicutes bacterium]|nr:Cof-type HAD-IIB family hydrolase [Bacillota bacterium]